MCDQMKTTLVCKSLPYRHSQQMSYIIQDHAKSSTKCLPYQQSIFVAKDYNHKLESGCTEEELLVE